MSTFIDPAKVRRLAASGDNFWKGAAWVLDQQDAARIDPTDYDNAWERVPEVLAACREGRADLAEERRKINNRAAQEIAGIIDAPVANAADLGAPRVP